MTIPAEGRVFIAYDPQDAREAQEMCARLERAGFGVWLPGRDSAGAAGDQIYAAVRSAAERSAALLLVLSGRAVDVALLGELTRLADAAGKALFPVRVGAGAQVPDFPALARAKAWIDGCGPAAEQEFARLAGELAALAPRHVAAPVQQPPAAPDQASPPPAFHAPPPPGAGEADWNSLDVQPGETPLGTWMVALRSNGPDFSGALTVTDRRLLFRPKVAGTSLVTMMLSQTQVFKDRNTVVLARELIVDVRSERRMINNWITVTTAAGDVIAFNRGPLSAEPVLAALRAR